MNACTMNNIQKLGYKKEKTVVFLIMLCFVGLTNAYAYDFSAVCSTGQTLYYTITDNSNHLVKITCPNSENMNCWTGFTKPSGNISLPESVQFNGVNYRVSAIGNWAFYECSELSGSLTIPNSVVTIGANAFWGCNFTGNLTLGDSVTMIGDCAFIGCNGFVGNLIIPNSVTSIGSNAFAGCWGFTGSLIIPNSVTYMGDFAFSSCSGFSGDLIIGNSVTTIGHSAFRSCDGFTGNLTIGNSVIEIKEYAFEGCSGFSGSLTLGNSVKNIRESAFADCSGFTGNLVIPNSVDTIGPFAFFACNGFTGNLILGDSVLEIGPSAFFRCSGFVGDLIIPNSISEIKFRVFMYCSGFNGDLVIPSSVTEIGEMAFCDCTGFTGGLNIPNSVVEIRENAFEGCSGFTGNLIIPSSITKIRGGSFAGCSGFSGLTIPNTVVEIGGGAFSGCGGFIGTLNIPNSVTRIGSNAFRYCSGFTGNLIIPDSITEIQSETFFYCSGFTGGLTIPNSVTKIGKSAFHGCTGFSGNLVIPNTVTRIGSNAFSSCSGFTGSLVIPNSVKLIDNETFAYCYGFSSLTIGSAVKVIDDYAFFACDGLESITILSDIPPSMGTYVWDGDTVHKLSLDVPIYVSCGTIPYYQNSRVWSDFTNYQWPEPCSPIASSDTIIACDRYLWHGNVYTTSTILVDTLYTANCCDSIVTHHISVSPTIRVVDTVVVDDSLTWNNRTYTNTGVYQHVQHSLQPGGCDSTTIICLIINKNHEDTIHVRDTMLIRDSIYLSVNHMATTEVACDNFLWNGTSYTFSGNYTNSHLDANGCTQVDTLHLTINTPIVTDVYDTACDNYTWFGTTYTATGDYVRTGTSALPGGCDTTETLHLTINYSVTLFDTLSLLDNELPYNYHGNNIEGEGDYTFSSTTVEGCDSTMHLHVYVNQTGVVEAEIVDEISLYPNPTAGLLTIEGEGIVRVEVMDMTGRVTMKRNFSQQERTITVDLSNMPQGSYIVRIVTGNGSINRRLVKK